MTASGIKQESYNKFGTLTQLSYNIVAYLMANDDLIWRLLKYSSPDAWRENSTDYPDLTKAQKGALIWKGMGDQTDYRVFFDIGQDYSWNIASTILRVAPLEIVPDNYIHGTQCITFEVYTHYSLSTMSNYATRNLSVIQRLIEVLNGADIEGIGRLYFDYYSSSRCKTYIIGQIPYRGMALVMCNKALG